MRKCPYCGSIWVCWNWIHAYGGDRDAYEKANPHIDPKDLKDWGHECWDCEGCSETHAKVRNGMPYWILRRFYRIFRRVDMTKLKEAQNLFESIICLCAEGREVVAREHLLDAIEKEAEKGYETTKEDGIQELKDLIQKANNYLSGGGCGGSSVQQMAQLWESMERG